MQQQRTEFTSSNNRTSTINQLQEIANLKTLEFFFDQNNKVNYVIANGFPDSIRYEIRKNKSFDKLEIQLNKVSNT